MTTKALALYNGKSLKSRSIPIQNAGITSFPLDTSMLKVIITNANTLADSHTKSRKKKNQRKKKGGIR